MKNLFFAGSFAIASLLAFGFNHGGTSVVTKESTGFYSMFDTLPKSKKDSMKKKKNWGKDSTMKHDSLHPHRDTTQQQ